MKQFLIVISYKDKKGKQTLAMQDTRDDAEKWVRDTLVNDNIEYIVLQQFAIIETIKFEKDEDIIEDPNLDA